jgi:Mg-chelatase subunit ChlD
MDLALVLAFDGSASVSFEEFALIAGGTAAALRDKQVANALTQQGSLLSVLLFSGSDAQDLAVPWSRIEKPADLAAFADAVENMPRVLKPGLTAIGNALIAAETLLTQLPEPASRHIVDIAADGRANAGTAPGPERDRMEAAGITINALCVLHEEPDLVETATREVIGGPGCFAQPCASYADFAEAMRRKLLREALVA